MRTQPVLISLAVLGLGAASIVANAASATAAPAGDTTVTVELSGGLLSISSPATATATGSVSPGSVVNVAMSDTTVTDERGSLLGWSVTGSATDLTTGGGGANRTIPTTNMVWATGSVSTIQGSGVGVTGGAPAPMALPWVVATAVPTAGAGMYTYPSEVTITVPAGLYAGSYTGTVTQSVA